MLVLTEAGYPKEADLALRSLLENTANAAYMLADPQSRAAKFEASDSISRRRVFESLRSFELGSDELREQVAAEFEKEFEIMRGELGETMDDESLAFRPFNVSAKKRIEAIGPSWYYSVLYQPSSDFTHMNARAVASLMRTDSREGGHLVVGSELLIRLLYNLNDVLGVPNRPGIDSYSIEYAKFHEDRGEVRGTIVDYLSGEQYSEADADSE